MLSSFFLLAACGNKTEVVSVDLEKTTVLGECLADNGWTMYGTSTCPHCKNQKALFGAAFEEVNYIDCIAESQKCAIAGISGVPVWRGPNSLELQGTQQLQSLAEAAGCAWSA
jgi:hypothetical protein